MEQSISTSFVPTYSPSASAHTMRSLIALSLFICGTGHQTVAFSPSVAGRSRLTISGKEQKTSTSLGLSSIATATGEADRAFRLGIQLEKAGLARAASAAFHEAATLYQCFLDSSDVSEDSSGPATNIFQHVTSLSTTGEDTSSDPTVLAVLAYACIRLGHLSHDAFGDSRASKRLYRLAASIDPHPSAVAYHGIGTSFESSIPHTFGQSESDDGIVWREGMEKACVAYREASKLGGGLGSNGEVKFHLAVALEVSVQRLNVLVLC